MQRKHPTTYTEQIISTIIAGVIGAGIVSALYGITSALADRLGVWIAYVGGGIIAIAAIITIGLIVVMLQTAKEIKDRES